MYHSIPQIVPVPINFGPCIVLKVDYIREQMQCSMWTGLFNVYKFIPGQTLKEVLVRMEKQLVTKPFLGGYRNKETGVEYHHASAQAVPNKRSYKGVMNEYTQHTALCVSLSCVSNQISRFERDTQTVVTLNRRQQVMVDAATQMVSTVYWFYSHRSLCHTIH